MAHSPNGARDGALYNEDLAPIPADKRQWGAFEIFNVWNNDIQSLFGYSLAASLFITYGLNGWAVFAAIVLAGFFVMVLVNLTGRPSVRYGVPYPVMARASMGVYGARFPALVRGIVAFLKSTKIDLETGDGENVTEMQLLQNKMMFARIKYQALAIVVVVILLAIAN